MSRAVLSLMLLAAFLCPSPAGGAEPAGPFAGVSAVPGGILRLAAAEPYVKLKEDGRRAAVEAQAKARPGVALAVVEYNGNGELWRISGAGAELADSWSRGEMRFARHARKAGRWFGHVGGQFVRGGDYPSDGWTARLGTTLFKDRYDAALSLSRNSFTEADDSATTSLGLTVRALYPYTRHAGLNLGLQLDRVSYTGYSHLSPSVVGGINIYLPGGSFDISLSCGEYGRTSLLAGYTVYISK